jgi:hypothetical protein
MVRGVRGKDGLPPLPLLRAPGLGRQAGGAGADERHTSREFRQKVISEIRKIRVIRVLVSSSE